MVRNALNGQYLAHPQQIIEWFGIYLSRAGTKSQLRLLGVANELLVTTKALNGVSVKRPANVIELDFPPRTQICDARYL